MVVMDGSLAENLKTADGRGLMVREWCTKISHPLPPPPWPETISLNRWWSTTPWSLREISSGATWPRDPPQGWDTFVKTWTVRTVWMLYTSKHNLYKIFQWYSCLNHCCTFSLRETCTFEIKTFIMEKSPVFNVT